MSGSGNANQNNPKVTGQGVSGQVGLYAGGSHFNAVRALIKQFMGEVRTAVLVQVQACTNDGDLSPVGFVDVIPMVNLMDGLGVCYPHGTVFNLAYFRLQGGKNAVIIDPAKGDIGIAVICDRDSSVVKNTKAIGNPGSRRRFDLSDGMYFGGLLNPAPTQYIQFLVDDNGHPIGINVVDALGNSIETSNTGINVADKNGNTIVANSSGITINGVLFDRSQNITNIEEATSQGGVKLTQHVHPGVQSGSSNTGLPTG